MTVLSRGFRRGRSDRADDRLPPGQYDVGDAFPVLSAGPTPHVRLERWEAGATLAADAQDEDILSAMPATSSG